MKISKSKIPYTVYRIPHSQRFVFRGIRNTEYGIRLAFARGFTLIELLVICAILVVISGLILANNSQFGGVVRLESLAYDIALSVRQAQVYGISVARFGTNTYSAGYGVHFDLSSPSVFIFFGDAISANGLYDNGELVSTTNIQGGYRLAQLCVTPTNSAEDCTKTKLDILFQRPEPDAWIASNSGADSVSCVLSPNVCYESARIVVISPRGDLLSVLVDVNGQISVRRVP